MKAIRTHEFGDPEVLKLEEVADPKPGPGQVVVTVKAAGVNPVDTYIRNGTYSFKPQLPYTPGADAAGVIESVGSEVKTFKPGDRVWVGNVADMRAGTYAQKVLCELKQVHPLPDAISYSQGAAVNVPYITAYHGLVQMGEGKAGDTVLVHGATGGVGLACVQIGVALGMMIIGTGGSEKGRKLVRDQGAAHVFDHKKPDYLDEIKSLTGGKGVDVVCEMLANVNLGKDLTVLAQRGRIAIIGNRGTIEIDPRKIMQTHGKVVGVSPPNDAERAQANAAISAGLFNGTLKPVVDVEYPLTDAAKAHADVMSEGSHGKIVLIP
jgi:NADPH2:quinone reductase